MITLGPGQIRFLVHGPDAGTDEMVSASVFATKLGTLVRALRAADRAVNGVVTHDYKIARLQSSSPTAILVETDIPGALQGNSAAASGITGFSDCSDAVIEGDRERALRYGNCASLIGALAKGANKRFGYAEVWTREQHVIRVDPFLVERSKAIISPKEVIASESVPFFKGVAFGSFDGVVKEVDLRGALPEIKLVLSAGGHELDCVCRAEDLEKIRTSLDRRVQIYGRAIYDGKIGLPRRVEVSDIQPFTATGDLSRWKQAFEPFEPSEWEGDG